MQKGIYDFEFGFAAIAFVLLMGPSACDPHVAAARQEDDGGEGGDLVAQRRLVVGGLLLKRSR